MPAGGSANGSAALSAVVGISAESRPLSESLSLSSEGAAPESGSLMCGYEAVCERAHPSTDEAVRWFPSQKA